MLPKILLEKPLFCQSFLLLEDKFKLSWKLIVAILILFACILVYKFVRVIVWVCLFDQYSPFYFQIIPRNPEDFPLFSSASIHLHKLWIFETRKFFRPLGNVFVDEIGGWINRHRDLSGWIATSVKGFFELFLVEIFNSIRDFSIVYNIFDSILYQLLTVVSIIRKDFISPIHRQCWLTYRRLTLLRWLIFLRIFFILGLNNLETTELMWQSHHWLTILKIL